MSDVLERLRSDLTAEVTLPSGLQATLQLPRVRDCVIAGDLPMPVLVHLENAVRDGEAPEMTNEERRVLAAFNDRLVMMTVVALEGGAVELSQDDLRLIPEEDQQDIVLYASRSKPLPGKE